jgi:hypothetical protein
MKGFDEWFFEQLGDRDETQPPFKIARMWATGAYKAGAASRQAEIDELQKRIGEALSHVLNHGGYDDLTHIVDILKGKQDD